MKGEIRRFNPFMRTGIIPVCIASILLTIGAGMTLSDTPYAATPDTCNTTSWHDSNSCDGFYYKPTTDGPAYTANGLKSIADDLSENGVDSQYYTTFHSALVNDSGRGMMWLRDDKTPTGTDVIIRLIGINQDTKADGTGEKAGLTFQTLLGNNGQGWTMPDSNGTWTDRFSMNSDAGNTGGWSRSKIRRMLDDGSIRNSMPDGVRSSIVPVLKTTNGPYSNQPTDSSDKSAMSNASTDTTADYSFLLTPIESGLNAHTSTSWYQWYPDYKASDDEYEYWSDYGYAKEVQQLYDMPFLYFRSPSAGFNNSFSGYYRFGMVNLNANFGYYIAPAFSF